MRNLSRGSPRARTRKQEYEPFRGVAQLGVTSAITDEIYLIQIRHSFCVACLCFVLLWPLNVPTRFQADST
jgi:hypothetical protein